MKLAAHHRHHTPLVHKKGRKPDDVRSEINVTPLVDVCLVLLIIFMMVMDKLTRGMDVKLPQAKYFNENRDTGEDLIISVTKPAGGDIAIFWDRTQLPTVDALKAKLQDELGRRSRPVFLKADQMMSYADVYPVMMAIHDAGAPNVLLGTVEKKN